MRKARALGLASLHLSDAIVVFEGDTPASLIELIEPDVLVKGGDWNKEDIVGGDFVEGNGGKVEVIETTDGYSTTSIIDRLN
jgi:D-beta-D-heptose 7-phosphate kinase/D-beta-D-heptose 1-phosphate adenosyltransferase